MSRNFPPITRGSKSQWRLLLWIIVVAIIIAVTISKQEQTAAKHEITPSLTAQLQLVSKEGLQQVNYDGFTVYFNEQWHLPACVAYELTDAESQGSFPRKDNWATDDTVKGCPVTADYRYSGYDRGHMAPAGDLKWSEKALRQSFYLTNACPQNHSLNEGAWNKLETKVREWAQRDSALIVLTGPIVSKRDTKTVGETGIRVPGAFYKIILAHHENPMRVIAFVYPNERNNGDLASHATTVRDIEHRTGINFFECLPQEEQDSLETAIYLNSWLN